MATMTLVVPAAIPALEEVEDGKTFETPLGRVESDLLVVWTHASETTRLLAVRLATSEVPAAR